MNHQHMYLALSKRALSSKCSSLKHREYTGIMQASDDGAEFIICSFMQCSMSTDFTQTQMLAQCLEEAVLLVCSRAYSKHKITQNSSVDREYFDHSNFST
jgi:hypothetical protein